MSVSTGKPSVAALQKARQPYVLFDKKLDANYTVRVRYLTKNVATNAAQTSEVVAITSRTEIPILPEQFHTVLMLLIGRMIAGELAPIRNRDGSIRFPGMADAFEYFNGEYEKELTRAKEKADRKYISRVPPACNWGGLEISYLSGHPYNR